jgi:hypothetical protein
MQAPTGMNTAAGTKALLTHCSQLVGVVLKAGNFP